MFFTLNFFNLFIFRESGREGEREGEKHQCIVASHTPCIGDLACNPGMCPDWELNQPPFGLQAGIQSTELHQPGLFFTFLKTCEKSKEGYFVTPEHSMRFKFQCS